MSALGHEQTSRHARVMSVLSLKADIRQCGWVSAKCQKRKFGPEGCSELANYRGGETSPVNSLPLPSKTFSDNLPRCVD